MKTYQEILCVDTTEANFTDSIVRMRLISGYRSANNKTILEIEEIPSNVTPYRILGGLLQFEDDNKFNDSTWKLLCLPTKLPDDHFQWTFIRDVTLKQQIGFLSGSK